MADDDNSPKKPVSKTIAPLSVLAAVSTAAGVMAWNRQRRRKAAEPLVTRKFSETLRKYLEARERQRFEQSKPTPSRRELETIEEELTNLETQLDSFFSSADEAAPQKNTPSEAIR